MSPAPLSSVADAVDILATDALLSDEERAIRASVRGLCAEAIDPHIAQWWEDGTLPQPRALALQLGSLGLLGMHLEGYGCAGMSATAYGLACLELEATDSGILVCIGAGLARHVRDLAVGERRPKARVAAANGRGREDRMLRPHRTRPRI